MDDDNLDRYTALMAGPNADPHELVDALFRRPWWHAWAACRGQGPTAWFPGRGQQLDQLRAVCEHCDVRLDCLEAGLGERHGVWGGTSERERRRARRAGWDAAELIAWADRPAPPPPVYDGPACAHCGGLLSRKDRDKGAVFCWACAPRHAPTGP